MIIFDEGQEREITRKRALGLKRVVIMDDVERGDEVDMQADGDDLVIFKKENQSIREGEEPVYTFITKEIGLFGLEKGFKSLIELKICDDTMIVNLIAGSIVIRPEGNLMKASRAINTSQVPECSSDSILWIDVERILGYLKNFAKFADKYPYDYEYYLEIGGTMEKGLEGFAIKRHSDSVDISCGALAIKENEQIRKENAKESRKMANMFMNFNSNYELDVDEDEEDEEDEDNYYDDEY